MQCNREGDILCKQPTLVRCERDVHAAGLLRMFPDIAGTTEEAVGVSGDHPAREARNTSALQLPPALKHSSFADGLVGYVLDSHPPSGPPLHWAAELQLDTKGRLRAWPLTDDLGKQVRLVTLGIGIAIAGGDEQANWTTWKASLDVSPMAE